MHRITHYRNKCIGCNACVEAAPDRWRISPKDGKSVLIGAVAKKEIHSTLIYDFELDQNKIAVHNCPVGIIKISIVKEDIKSVLHK